MKTAFIRLLALGLASLPGTLPASAAEPDVVRIATFAYVDHGQVKLGGSSYYDHIVADKWLETELAKRGVKLEWVPISGSTGPLINEAFTSRQIDFATYGDLPSIILNASGVHTRVIVPDGHGIDAFLVVPPNSTAKSIQDLKGKRIGVQYSRPWELSMLKLFDLEGLSTRDFHIINLDDQAGTAALASGNIDGLFSLSAYILEDKKIGKIIWSSRHAPVTRIRAELWGTQDFADKYPDITQLVATAFVRDQYWASQPENQEAIFQAGSKAGTPESVVRRNFDDPKQSWKDHWSPQFDDLLYAQFTQDINLAYSKGVIRHKLNASDLVDTRFTDKALKDLNLVNYWPRWSAKQQ